MNNKLTESGMFFYNPNFNSASLQAANTEMMALFFLPQTKHPEQFPGVPRQQCAVYVSRTTDNVCNPDTFGNIHSFE